MSQTKRTELVVLAAGMGSRYGSLKQLASFGPAGQTIIDYTVYDARSAGFDRAIVIIKRAFEKEFRDTIGRRIESQMDVDYAFQEFDLVPSSFQVDPARVKPLGTGHAILCAKDQIKAPFCVVNSDDFYGRDPFVAIHHHLTEESDCCMAGYRLGNTLTEKGGVNRGICDVDDNGYLTRIVETMNITRQSGISLDSVVSMNMWGLTPDLLPLLEEDFLRFTKSMQDPIKDEHYLPNFIDDMIHAGKARVRVLPTDAQWHGVTYREDADALRAAIADLYRRGVYPNEQ